MRLSEITGKDLVLLELESELRTDAIRELVELIARHRGYSGLLREEYLAEILRRHDHTPSGLGHGLAFPNARISNLEHPTLAIGLSRHGLNFQARDGRPAHVVFLYLGRSTPLEEERLMLSRLSQALADPKTADSFMGASTVEEVWKAVLAIDQNERVGAR